jgi:hypothetical protein
LRRFPSLPRGTAQVERQYDGRTAAERVNRRLKVYRGADDGNVVGSRRWPGRAGAVLTIHLAFAAALADRQRDSGSFGARKP